MNRITFLQRGAAVAVAVVALSACRPETQPLVICHNSNCQEPANPDEDDSIASLTTSLGLVDGDRPLIDGVEMDTFWYGAEDRCLFAHDLNSLETATAAGDAIDLINASLSQRQARGEALTHGGGPFQLFVELKGTVGTEKTDVHSDAQLVQHANCAVDVLLAFADAAVADDRPGRVVFTSFEPALLVATQAAIAERFTPPDTVDVAVMALFGIPPPLDGQTLPITAFDDVRLDGVSVHPQWLRQTSSATFASLDVEVGYWMFSAVPETLAAIDQHQPSFVTTSEATFMRRWLDR